jgi:hypothetical protein
MGIRFGNQAHGAKVKSAFAIVFMRVRSTLDMTTNAITKAQTEDTGNTDRFEVGKMYQVYYFHLKAWVLAEYLSTVKAHDYKYSNVWFGAKGGIEIGKDKVGHAPTTYYFKTAWVGSRFGVTKLSEVRDATPEAVAEVQRLRGEVARAEESVKQAKKDLKDFCI